MSKHFNKSLVADASSVTAFLGEAQKMKRV